jgi:hypothetical protein
VRAQAQVRRDHRLQPRRKVYPNLAGEMVLTGMDQLWRADITYIRLREEFVYLAVILDAFRGGSLAGRWIGTWRTN